MKKIVAFTSRASAERAVSKMRSMLPKLGFEVAMRPGGTEWTIRVYDDRGKFLTYSAPLERAFV